MRTLFDQLMSHVETKGDFVEHWSECLRNYEEFVDDDRFSRVEIERTMGMIDTNAHAVGNGIRGIYPTLVLMSHSCIRNAKLQFRPTYPYELTCRYTFSRMNAKMFIY